MNMYTLLFLQFGAHFLADFECQPESWCRAKRTRLFSKIHLRHAAIVFILSWLLSLGSPGFMVAAAGIAVCHLLIDVAKSGFEKQFDPCGTKWQIFLADQILHLLTVGGVVYYYSQTSPMELPLPVNLKTAAIFTTFIFCGKTTNILIKNVLRAYRIPMPQDDGPEKDDSLENAGRLIGVCERYISLALILGGQHAAVGLLITAKSILRFNVPRKNEYILIGTLLSFGIAIIAGMLVSRL